MPELTFPLIAQRVRELAGTADAEPAIRDYLQSLVADPAALLAITPRGGDDETLFFEDDQVSVWHCRFQPHVLMPPHEHQLKVFIAGYSGDEISTLYDRKHGRLVEAETVTVGAGQVIELDRDAIHSVTAGGTVPSEAIHVYLGPLMTLTRDLFDWDTGETVVFSMDAFQAMVRKA